MIPILNLFDVSLAFILLCIIYFCAILYKKEKINKQPSYKWFTLALTTKLVGGIGFALFSIYYYRGGDTFVFFNAAEGLRETLFSDFKAAMDVYFLNGDDFNPAIHTFAPRYNYILKSNDILTIVKLTSFINIFTVGSYLSSSIIFSFFSFLGLWFGYNSLSKIYPKISNYLLIPFFLIPTAILWSSGILKDTVTIGIIGWLLYAFSNIFIFKRRYIISIILIILGTYLMFLLKPYLLYVLIPSLFLWVQSNVRRIVSGSFVRLLVTPALIISLSISGYLLTQSLSQSAGKYKIENLENVLEGFHTWHEFLAENRNQSGYTLGEIELTPTGILKKVPAALNVTFFRPYPWEVRNIPTLLGAFEAIVFLVYFIYLVVTVRFSFFKLMLKNKEALFSMFFALVMGAIVGLSSYNFGALSRYKIPAQLFFIVALIIIQFKHRIKKAKSN